MQNDYATSECSKSEKLNGEVTYIDFSWVVHVVNFTRGACHCSREVLAQVEVPCTASQTQYTSRHRVRE